MTFSDYAIYADESGSPHLEADKDEFPIFVLVFLIVRKDHYCDWLDPAVQRLKFDFLGHDQIVLHERDIRRQEGAFLFLRRSYELRQDFLGRVGSVVEAADMALAVAIIDKRREASRFSDHWQPYHSAVGTCLSQTAAFLRSKGEQDRRVHIVFESRGHTEDQQLELSFGRIAGARGIFRDDIEARRSFQWSPVFADKRSNSTGLQVADLAARPLGLRYLRPDQPNRAADILKTKVLNHRWSLFPKL